MEITKADNFTKKDSIIGGFLTVLPFLRIGRPASDKFIIDIKVRKKWTKHELGIRYFVIFYKNRLMLKITGTPFWNLVDLQPTI